MPPPDIERATLHTAGAPDGAIARAGCSPETETPGLVVSRVADARAWLGEFYADLGDDGRVRLATLDHHGDGWAEFARGLRPSPGIDLPGYLDALAVALVNEADAGRDVFACPYPHPGPRRKGGATTRRHVHADVDGPLDLARVRFVGGLAVASGGLADDGVTPRGHVYVRLSESVPVHVHEALCRALGAHVGGEFHDESKTSDEDVLRPAGTLNHKPEYGPEPRPVRWLIGPDDDRVRTWEPETLARLLGLGWPIREPGPADDGPSFKPGLNVGGSLRRLDGLARSVTDAPHGEGNARLNWSAFLSGALCATDPDAPPADDVRAALVAAYLARPIPPGESVRSREREARRTVASGWQAGQADPARALAERHDDTTTTNGDHAVTLRAVDGDDGEVIAPGVVALEDPPTHVDLAALLADGEVPPEPVPDLLHRADGYALLYRGAINRLFGDYHSGKTWVVLAAAAEVLADGGRVALVDADLMGWRRFVRRLVLLGVGLDVLADASRFRMWMPDGSAGMAATVREVAAWSPDLVGLDSLGGVLARLRKSRNNPDDVADAMLTLGPLTADPLVCVVLLDHLAQSAESRKFGPSGSLEKGREVRGVSLRVEVVRRFVPGRGGAARLSVEKDTDGGVLARSEAGKNKREPVAGVFRLAPVGEDHAAARSLLWAVDAPTPGDLTADDAEVTDDRVTDAVVDYVREDPGAPGADVEEHVTGRREDVRAALVTATEAGRLTRADCGKGCAECARRGQRTHRQRVPYFPGEGADDDPGADADDPAEVAG